MKKKRMAWVCILIEIITGFGIIKFFNISGQHFEENANASNPFKIMSYNVRMFNLYNPLKKANNKDNRDSIFKLVQEIEPDIICFQEAYYDTDHKFKTIDTLKQIQKAGNVHAYYPAVRRNHNFGLVTMSVYPIINEGVVFTENGKNDLSIFSDILIGNDTIRIYNVHFASIGLSSEDFVFVENVSSLNIEIADSDELKEGFANIVKRLKKGFILRASQVNLLETHLNSSPYPYILCTDLNDTPSSFAYNVLEKNMKDAFLTAGEGIGKTYNGSLPYFRIDYIFYSKGINAYNFKTYPKGFSDHFPITSIMTLD
ncbi:MAG: endonuclease/exonuclease/phosphatase family protein [Bacteroidales bacterium]|nr:endonuclease/exonuclease/phosphatase family protein [Bacteroidales bacterium]